MISSKKLSVKTIKADNLNTTNNIYLHKEKEQKKKGKKIIMGEVITKLQLNENQIIKRKVLEKI